MSSFDYTTFLSPFTWRYGSDKMRRIWSETYKRQLWRKIWVTLAKAQHYEGLVSKRELDDLIKHQNEIDIDASHEIEKETHHDVMAEIQTFAKQAKIGGGKIHLGATSTDIEDNADALRSKESLLLLEKKLKRLLLLYQEKIRKYKSRVCMGYTHLQPAEPTTLGYRFAVYAQDALYDLTLLRFVKQILKGKGIKGAVGTSASYTRLFDGKKTEKMEKMIMEALGIGSVSVSSQTSPRKLDSFVAMVLSSLSQSLTKFAFDVRIMQSPGFSEWQEPFGKKQIGSSAMPFKRNPLKSEQICSLGRLVIHLGVVAQENASMMLLERTLDDSANRRVFLPEMFLAVDQMLETAIVVFDQLLINEKHIEKNLSLYAPFAATEIILMETVKKGANRQKQHEILREHAFTAWKEVHEHATNPLLSLLQKDKSITKFIPSKTLETLFDATTHIGLAEKKCTDFLKLLDDELSY